MPEEKQELVTIERGTPVTTSLKVAGMFGKDHSKIIRSIEKLAASPEVPQATFGLSEYVDESGKTNKLYYMNRDGFSLLVMGFTGNKALKFKVAYIQAFNAMERFILESKANRQAQGWIQARSEGITARKGETDIIASFITYAIGQGSKSAHWYYKHVTDATYKALFLIETKHPTLRPLLTIDQLGNLMTAERMIQRKIKEYMDKGVHYKQIFQNLKSDLLAYSALVGTSRVALPEPKAFQPAFLLGA